MKLHSLDKKTLKELSLQLGNFHLTDNSLSQTKTDFDIVATLEVLYIILEDLIDLSKDFDSIIKHSGKWQIQISNNGRATRYARVSFNHASKQWQINSFLESKISTSVDTGLKEISKREKSLRKTYQVALLAISSFSVSGLLFQEDNIYKILVIDKPKNLNLDVKSPYLFDNLRKILLIKKPIEGIIKLRK